MKNYINKIKSYIIAHKIISAVVLVVILFLGYWAYGKITSTALDTRYITAKVEKGTIMASVSGSGQVSSLNQVDIKAKVSGDVAYVGVKSGDAVKSGHTLFTIDAGDASKRLRDAQLDYDTTKISLDNSLNNKLLALHSNAVAVPNVNNRNTNIISISGSYTSATEGRYTITAYDCTGGSCYRYEGLESGTDLITLNVSKPLGANGLYIAFSAKPQAGEIWTIDIPSPQSPSYYTNLQAYNQAKIENENTLQQKQNAVTDAEDAIADYSIRAPFDGTVASISVKKFDTIGAGTAVATLITKTQLAEISLNEVDVAKIKIAQKATLTFDAIPDLTISGVVADIDSIGTVSQGVVTYIVKISFDTQDERVKTEMSVSADIITDTKQDVLIVPNSAVKSQKSISYVEGFDTPLARPTDGLIGSISKIPPNKIPVEVGLSNDRDSEIISGIKEGDEIVVRTILPTTAKAAAPSIFGSTTNRGGGNGGAVRVPGK